jgi:SecD/SecF fusion protein
MSSQKVGPTISDDIKMQAFWAILFALIGIFLYIFLRFRDWRFGVAGIISLAHDSLIVLGVYSLLKDAMPFAMEIDSAFIAAILTVIGYSINDTVIIYDRIREYRVNHPKWNVMELFNGAMNSTLARTMNTSLTTLFVLFVIFVFGGEVIRGFVFALLIGIGVGTYSSIFNAAPIVYDFLNRSKK